MPICLVACAWCGGELQIPAPNVVGSYFLLSRRCPHCKKTNTVEVAGTHAQAVPHRRERSRAVTQKVIRLAAGGGLTR
jgi:hypothetical protein